METREQTNTTSEPKREEKRAANSIFWLWKFWMGSLLALLLLWTGWLIYAFLKTQKRDSEKALWAKSLDIPGGKKYLPPPYQKFKNFDQVLKAAQEQKKPIFLDLYALWCYPCKKLEKETLSHYKIHRLLQKFVAVKFNVDKPEGQKLLAKYRVERFPTTLMLSSDGRELERVVGFYQPRFYRPALEAALALRPTYSQLMEQHRKQPQNLKLKLELADRALLRRKIQQARALYRELINSDPDGRKSLGDRAFFGLARSFSRVGKYTKCIELLEQFEKRFKNSPVLPDVLRLKAYCYDRIGQKKKSQKVVSLFKKQFPNQPLTFE